MASPTVETSDRTPGGAEPLPDDNIFENDRIEQMLENFRSADLYEKHNRDMARADLDIISGKSWTEEDERQRKLDGRPCLKFPVLNQYTDQVIGDWRQNRVDVVVSPGAGQREAVEYVDANGKKVKSHEAMAGMIRSVAKKGGAEQARDTAFEHAVSCGFGHYRVVTEYVGDTFNQTLRYKKISDQFSVYWDPAAQEYDRRDAQWAIIIVTMPKQTFKMRYPGKAVHDNLPTDTTQHASLEGWFTDDETRVAEYFWKEPETKMMYLLPDGRVIRDDDKTYDSIMDELAMQGLKPVNQREVEDHTVMYMQSTGVEVIDGPRPWPGRFIPIMSVWGKEHPEGGGRITYRSLIRYAHDAQKMFDFMRSAGIERAALEPKVPYVMGASQVGPYGAMWKTANTVNHAYLLYDDSVNATPPQRNFPAQPSQGYFQEAAQALNDIKASVGMYDAAVGAKSNETSGKAILARQRESDIMSFPFIDNMGRTIQYEYEVVADLIPNIFDTRQVMRMLNADESEVRLTIFDEMLDEQTGKKVILNDISKEKFDISVDVGPSYTTQRQQTAEAMLEFIGKVDGAGQLTGDLVAKALDFVGKDDFARRLKYLLPPEVRQAEDEEAQGNQPLPAHIQQRLEQQQMMLQSAEQAINEMEPKMQQAESHVAKVEAENAQLKIQQQLAKERADIDRERDRVNYDKRVIGFEKRMDDMDKARGEQDMKREAEVRQQAEQTNVQSESRIVGAIEQFNTTAERLAGNIEQQTAKMDQAVSVIGEAAAQMGQSAKLMSDYFTAPRMMQVDATGKPTRMVVKGFGEVVINEEPGAVQ